jgi:hypothetical protein
MPVKDVMSNMPFAGTVADSLELMQKVWGAAGMPSATGMAKFAAGLPQALPQMIAPTLDVDELDKRIADLRAVESWLALNQQMLRTTIQTLEVQRNTIATLKSFGGSMLAAMPMGGPERRTARAASGPERRARIDPFGGAAPAATAGAGPEPQPVPASAPMAPTAGTGKRTGASQRARARSAPAANALPMNPALWWNSLQDQFTRVAAAAASTPDKPRAAASSPAAATSAAPAPGRRASKARPAARKRG